MRDQAKKMNVTSLRSSEENKTQSTEAKLAKVALMTITLWFMAWTPYLVINWGGMFSTIKITPLFSIMGSGEAIILQKLLRKNSKCPVFNSLKQFSLRLVASTIQLFMASGT